MIIGDLTGQRREEVAGMTWAELSEDLATWTIPATRTKNGVPHLVPLSQPARELLHSLRSDGESVQRTLQDRRAKLALVLPGERGTPFSGWSKAKSALDTASGVSGWWLHDLRRSLATGLQRLGVRLEVTEAVLNHLSGRRAGVVGIYQRHWSAHLPVASAHLPHRRRWWLGRPATSPPGSRRASASGPCGWRGG
jgi:integrase